MKTERLYAAHRKGALTITLISVLNILNGEELEKSCPAFSVRPLVVLYHLFHLTVTKQSTKRLHGNTLKGNQQ